MRDRRSTPGEVDVSARVDFCATTFLRPKAIERLVHSIGRRYPSASVVVGDQNEKLDRSFYEELSIRAGLSSPLTVLDLDFDCGVSAARNRVVAAGPREYKLILDDDGLLTEHSDIGKFVRLLDAHPDVGVVGGAVVQGEHVYHARSRLHRHGGTLDNVRDRRPYREWQGIRYIDVEFVSNFILVRRELFDLASWDADLKTFEHHDFYLSVKETPFSVWYTPDVSGEHSPVEGEPGYARFRGRTEYIERMFQKHGLTRITFGGRRGWELRDGGGVVRIENGQ